MRISIDNARKRLENLGRFAGVIDTEHDAGWLLGDLSATTFWSLQTLEARLEKAIGDPSWRENVAGGIAARARSELTHDALWRKMLAMVSGALGETAQATDSNGPVSEAA